MKRAVISDIHGNLEALTAVLEDIEQQEVDSVYCLGDIVGYGPNPRECIDRVRALALSVLGNHDSGALFDPEGFSSGAEKAIFWTRGELENAPGDEQENRDRWDYLCQLPRVRRLEDWLMVHGSPRNPLTEYVFPDDVHNTKKLEKIFALVPRYSFQGHTHVPGIFTEERQFLHPDEVSGQYRLKEEKLLINVGSVGQPRDGDPRACYLLVDDDLITFRRIDYDRETTIKKIYEVPELDNFLGDRLREGH